MEYQRVGILGASGFVGAAVADALADACEVVPIRAPRLELEWDAKTAGLPDLDSSDVGSLAEQLTGLDVVVNAAGDPNASGSNLASLVTANAYFPLVAMEASKVCGVSRFIQVSSAVVQGDKEVLDATVDVRPFSPYSLSKSLAERWLFEASDGATQLVIYRPPSVHARGRGVTVKVSRLASGPLRTVAGSGRQPTPQALLGNVASAISFLVLSPMTPPNIVHHPWEGLSARDLMRFLGGKEPHHVPAALCKGVVGAARGAETAVPRLSPYRRRLQMMWFGQEVAPSWLTSQGWTPPLAEISDWLDLARDYDSLGGTT